MMRVELPRLRCPYCSHVWVPRKPEVRACPRCKNKLARFSPEELVVRE